MATIYKYYAPNENNRDALLNGYFWFSKTKLLNDPFDLCAEIIECYPCFKQVLVKKYKNMDSFYKKAHEYAICSFTTDNLNKHMWALYAESYKGWCLEFEENQIVDAPTTGVPPKFYNCSYLSEFPDLNNSNTQLEISTQSGSHRLIDFLRDPKDEDKLFAYLLSVKEKNIWETETEKRLFLGNIFYYVNKDIDKSAGGYKIPWKKENLKSIIMGCNISKSDKNFLGEIACKYNVALKKVKPVIPSKDFRLEIE